MTSDLKTAIKYITLFSIGVGALYLVFQGQDLEKIWNQIKKANYFWIGLSALSVLIAHFLRALRWRLLYRSIRYPVSTTNSYHAVIIGYLANLAVPRLGELIRCSVMRKAENVPMFASIGTVITERLFDVLILLLAASLMLGLQYDLVSDFVNQVIINGIISRFHSLNHLWILGIGLMLFIFIGGLVYFLRQRFSKRLLRIFVNLRQGFGSYHAMESKIPFLFYSLLIWIFYFLSMFLAFYGLEATSQLKLNAAFTLTVFSGFAMVVPVQGGIGVFHWMVAKALMLYHISFNEGLAYATLIHSSQILLVLVFGGISICYLLSKKQSYTDI